jgi:hypothetical protein
MEPDPLDPLLQRAVALGWRLVPQVAHGGCDNALMLANGRETDIVTIPWLGDSTVVRLRGGPGPAQLRRTGTEKWRHYIPVEDALHWLLQGLPDGP